MINIMKNIEDLSGLSKNHPLISLSLLIILFSLAGIPPMAGFFAKFYVFYRCNKRIYVFFGNNRFVINCNISFLLFKNNKNYLF